VATLLLLLLLLLLVLVRVLWVTVALMPLVRVWKPLLPRLLVPASSMPPSLPS
jgi:hypothetical protein